MFQMWKFWTCSTEKVHRFVPLNETHLEVYKISNDSDCKIVNTYIYICDGQAWEEVKYVCVWCYVAWYLGYVKTIYEYFHDYLINFIQPQGLSKEYTSPLKRILAMLQKNMYIILKLKTPKFLGRARIK